MFDYINLVQTLLHKGLLLSLVFLGFGLLISIHECGHFLFAKLFGVATPTFSIGMGPVIFQKKAWGTDFCLSLLPVGGYVEIATKPEPNMPKLPYGSYFNDKPYWQKLFIMLGGITFNLISAFLIYAAVFAHGKPTLQIKSLIINEVLPHTAAEKAGLQKDDIITHFNKQELATIENFSLATFLPKNKNNLSATVERNNKTMHITIHVPDAEQNPRVGIQYSPHVFSVSEQKLSFIESIKEAANTTKETMRSTFFAIKSMFVSRSLKNAGGPVMIFSQSFKMAEQGLKALFLFLAFISINLALINFLPLGALDGGQIFFVTVEWIIRRELPDFLKLVINLFSLLLFVGLALYLTFFDVLRIFFS